MGGRHGRWFERFAEMCQDLPERPWIGNECNEPDVATKRMVQRTNVGRSYGFFSKRRATTEADELPRG